MGKGLTDLAPPQGFAAQTSAATVILASSHLGFSLSTTQSCSGAVMGAGLGRKGGVVRWSTATRMFVAWGLTLPAAGLVGAGAELLTKQGTWGVILTGALLVVGSAVIWGLSRRQPVTHDNVNDVGEVDAGLDAVPADAAAITDDLKATIPAQPGASPEPAKTASV
jgi:PiT family inorganic phosphate transporter